MLGKQLGATVVATASSRRRDHRACVRRRSEIVDYTSMPLTDADIVPVDALLNLVFVSDSELAGLAGLVAPGSGAREPSDDARPHVRGVLMFVRSDAEQLAAIVDRVDRGELGVDVSGRYPLSDVARVHQLSDDGQVRGKVVLLLAI
jgi:NADPH:quinone reductase-like Zn-dependent oxidoreductase